MACVIPVIGVALVMLVFSTRHIRYARRHSTPAHVAYLIKVRWIATSGFPLALLVLCAILDR